MTKKQISFLLLTAWRETKSNLKDFRVMVLSLFLGVFVISFIYNITGALENGLRVNGKAILGGDIMLRQIYNPITEEQLNYLEERGKISRSIEMRGLVYNPDKELTGLSEIKAVDAAYPLFGKVELVQGGVIDNIYDYLSGEEGGLPVIVMDDALAKRIEVEVGETVRLGSLSFRLKDIIENEPDRAGGGTFSVAPRAMISMNIVADTGLIIQGAQTYYKYRVDLENPEEIDSIEKTLNETYPEAAWRFSKYTNASPRIERYLGQLSLFFTLVGLAALLIGGVGIGNSVKVVLEKRMASIAIIKTVGASASFAFNLWLVVLVFVAMIGIVPALALAQILPFVIFDYVGDLLPVPAVPSIFIGDILQTLFLGFAILFIFSILSLSKAAQVKPALLLKNALTARIEGRAGQKAFYAFGAILIALITIIVAGSERPYFTMSFIGGALATFALLRLTSWLLIKFLAPLTKSKRTSLRLAVLSLVKEGNQTLTILISLGLALTLFTSIALIEHNIKNRIQNDIPEKAPAFFFIDIQKSQMPDFEAMLNGFEEVSNLNKVPNLRGRIKLINGKDAESALVDPSERWLLRGDRGFTYITEQPDYSDLLEGEWWPADYSGEPIVSVVEDVAEGFGVGVGDTVTVNILGRDITAKIANVRSVDWSTMTINFAISFAPGVLDSAPHSYLATISAPQELENSILSATAKQFPNVTAIQVRDALDVVTNILTQIAMAMRVIASLALVTGVLVLFSCILSTFRQRRYETILMKVIGVTPKMISRATKLEFIILGASASVLALVIGSLASYMVVVFIMDFEFVWSFSIAASIILTSLVITFAFSFWALSRILNEKPSNFLRNE